MRIIRYYWVHFKRHAGIESVRLTIAGGVDAMRLWNEGATRIMLKGAMYSTSEIATIRPQYAEGELERAKALKEGGLYEEAVQKLIEGEVKPQLTAGSDTK